MRSRLKAKLPEYMVPSAIVSLSSLPLSPNGKVDRRALPAPEARPISDEALVPPRNDLEETIAALWREVLHLERVGVHDNFFDLGGHSLLAIQVVTRLKAELKTEVSVATIFEGPTVESLSRLIAAEAEDQPGFEHSRDRGTKRKEERRRRHVDRMEETR
jgi:acyl carrier protein